MFPILFYDFNNVLLDSEDFEFYECDDLDCSEPDPESVPAVCEAALDCDANFAVKISQSGTVVMLEKVRLCGDQHNNHRRLPKSRSLHR